MNTLTITSQNFPTASIRGFSGRVFHRAPIVARIQQQYRSIFSPMERLVAVVPRNASVLDAGCQGGLFLALLAASGAEGRLVGYDPSPAAIECAKAMQTELQEDGSCPPMRFQQQHLHDSYPRGDFDVVSLLNLMPRIPRDRRAKAFRIAVEHLAPGGQILYKHVTNLLGTNSAQLYEVKTWARVLGLHLAHHEHIHGLPNSYDIICFRKPTLRSAAAFRASA